MSGERPCPFCHGTGKYREPDSPAPRELRWTVASDDMTGSHVALTGEITEQANLDGLAHLARPVLLDLGGVRYINTAGSNSLVRLVEALRGDITGERCSPAIVRQLNLMPDLSDHLRVKSVLLTHECPNCHVDYSVVVECSERRPTLATRRCGTCAQVLVPDEPVDAYFAFLPR